MNDDTQTLAALEARLLRDPFDAATRLAYARTFDFQTYIWAALLYLATVELLRHGVDQVERRITRHLRR